MLNKKKIYNILINSKSYVRSAGLISMFFCFTCFICFFLFFYYIFHSFIWEVVVGGGGRFQLALQQWTSDTPSMTTADYTQTCARIAPAVIVVVVVVASIALITLKHHEQGELKLYSKYIILLHAKTNVEPAEKCASSTPPADWCRHIDVCAHRSHSIFPTFPCKSIISCYYIYVFISSFYTYI